MNRNVEMIDNALAFFDGGKHWVKGGFWSGRTKENRLSAHGCMVGGLILSEYRVEDSMYASVEALPCTVSIRNAIMDLFGDRVAGITDDTDDINLDPIYAFNDHPDTTFGDVQLVFKYAREAEYEKWLRDTEEAIKQGEML